MAQDWQDDLVPVDQAATSPDWLSDDDLVPVDAESGGQDIDWEADLAPVESEEPDPEPTEEPDPEPTEPSRDELERMARTARMTGDLDTLKQIQSQIEGMDQSGGYDVREEFDTPAARLALGVGDTVAGAYQQTKSAMQGAVGGQLRAAGEAVEGNPLFDALSRYRSAAERYHENGGDLNDAIQGSESEIANALTGSAESVRLAQELSEQKVEEYRPENAVGAFLYDATGALAYMGPAMAATYLTRNPNAGPAAMFGMVGADEYNRQRTDGVEKSEAAQRAVLAGSYEAVPEHLFGVFGRFLKGTQRDRLIQAFAEGGAEATTFVAERLDSILRDESEYRGFWTELTDGLRAAGIGATVGGVMPIGTRREDPVKQAYQDSAASEDPQVQELTEKEREAYKKYDEAKGPTAKGPAFKEWWGVRRERKKAEEQARQKAAKKYDKKARKPDEPARTEERDDVTLNDIQLVEGVESGNETDLLNPEGEQEAPAAEEQAPAEPTAPDFTSATFTPLQAARELPPEPAQDAQPEDFRPVVDDAADPATSTTFAETMRSDIDGLPASYGMAFPGNLQVDAETYQYKQNTDTEGRTDRFTGDEKWDPSSAGTVIIHRREDGDYVADGHQRAGLARARREAGENPSNLFSQAIILNEADGWTPQDVRMVAAFKNVRQETGTAIDAAKLLREGGDAVIDALGESVNPKRAMWRDAQGLAGLSDPIFQEVVNGVVPTDRGAIIGRHISDPAKQRAALQYFQGNPPSTQYEAEIIARDINRLEAQEQTQGGLDFGDAVANVPIKERAKILDAARKLMNTRKKVFRQLVKDQAMIEGEAGNVLDEKGNVKIAQDAETVMEVLNRMVDTNAELNEVLNNAAAQLANGETTAADAARELVRRSEEVAASVLRGREDREGQREPAGAQEPTQREEQETQGPVRAEGDEGTQESLIPDAQAERTETQEAAEPETEASDQAADQVEIVTYDLDDQGRPSTPDGEVLEDGGTFSDASEALDFARENVGIPFSIRDANTGETVMSPAETFQQTRDSTHAPPLRLVESTEPAPTEEATDATQESTQDETAAERPEAEGRPAARPERTERPASPEGGRADGGSTGAVGGRSPRPEGVRPPLRVASEERIPEPRVYVDADQYQAGLDDNQRLAVNLSLDRFSEGGKGFMLADGTGVGKTRQILATADQYQQRFGKPVLVVTQNQQIIKGSFTDDARTMGIDLGSIEMATYDSVRSGKNGQGEYGLVIFDEAHNLKNFDAAKTIAANNIKTDHKLFATATPMDSVGGAVYFMSEVTGKPESAIYEQIGLIVRDVPNPDTGKMETIVQLAEGYQWSNIVENLIALRNEAVEQGAMLRREFPFYGEISTQNFTLTRQQQETQKKIEEHWDDRISNASNPAQRRNLAGQKLGELSRWVESQKVDEAFKMIQQKLDEGRSVVLVAEGVNNTNIKALGEQFPGALSALSARLDAAGIGHAKIYGSGPKDAAVDSFQSGQVRVALATPKSGGTGINLDDTVGDRPRTLVTLTANYAGDTFEQILGRVSRRNTASPAEAINLSSLDSISDARRLQILERKMQALRAIQVGDDLDAATVGMPEDGAQDVRLSVEGRPEGEAWSTDEVQAALEEMTAGWSVQPPMNVVKSESDLPDGIKLSIYHMNAQGRVRGVMAGGEIWVISDNVTERSEVERVLFHEAKGHLGLRGLLGEDIYPVLDRVYAAYGRKNLRPWIKAYVGEKNFDPKIQEHRWLVAEEKLASLAETDPESRWVKRAIGALREWLRRNTFLELSNLNESDMVHLLAKSSETLTRGLKPSEAGALPSWAQRDTIGGVRPTWGRFVEAIREWRVDQLRRFIKAVEPDASVSDMQRADLERRARQLSNFAGVADAPVPQAAWESLQGQDIRLSKLEEEQPSLFGEEVQSEAERKRKLQQRKEEIERKLGTDRYVDPESGDGDLFGGQGDDQQPLFSLVDADTKLAEKNPNIVQRGIVGTLRAAGTVPSAVNSTLDTMVRAPFAIVGGLDPIGRWKPGVAARDAVARALTEWKPKGESAPFKFVGYSLDFFRSKLVDRWNQTDTQREISRKAEMEKNAILRFMGKVLQRLEMEGLSNRDLITLTNILEGKQVSDKRLNELATPIRKTIDELGMELVRLGLLEKATWQKGVGKYLHRSYEKYERELSGIRNLPGMAQSFATRGFNKRIKGDELRARGIIEKVTQGRLQRNLPPQWWKKKIARSGDADKALKGTKWVILDKIVAVGEKNESLPIEDAGETKRVRKDRVYWPADEAIPDTYAGWENQGEFEVLGVKGQKVNLRRDYTDAEMEAMGRVMDARFNIIRTFQLLADDISTGRFFDDLAKSELSTTLDQVDQRIEKVVNTKSRIPPNLLTADWVEVPTDKIFPGSKVNQYGALAGRLVRPEVWREINQMDKAARKGPWLTLLRHWKANKALALDTPIPTLNGWTTMADIQVGDTVFDENGKPCEVLEVNDVVEGRPCYRVEFSDGSSIVCDEEHLWYTQRGVEKEGYGKIRTTAEIRDTLREQTRGDARHRIPVTGALDIPDADLPLDPYVLGVWLGDGHCGKACISTSEEDDQELRSQMEKRGVHFGSPVRDSRSTAIAYTIDIQPVAAGRAPNALKTALDEMGVLNDKKIPPQYLRASIEQRQEILRGLIDTDGWVTVRGECGLATSIEGLKVSATELITSLGYKPMIREFESASGRTAWRITFKPYTDRMPCTLTKKASRVKPNPGARQRSGARQIVNVVPVESVPVRCILVSSDSHLYLAGESMTPTHNTIRNPVVHMNNVMSNLVLLDLQDVDVNHLTRAMHELIHGGPLHQEAAENNAYSGIFVQNELNRTVMKPVMDEMVREIKTRDADSPQGQARIISTMKLATLRTVQGMKWVDQKAFNAYEMEDVVFRLATYMKYREMGLSQAEAAQLSVDAFLNYDIQAPWVNAARNSVMPFLAYSYRAIPTVGSALIHRPWKFAKYVALMELWNQFAFWFDDEGDEDLERATMRDQLQGMTWMSIPGTDIGLDRMVRYPWRDSDGRPLYQDVYRWIPVGDVMDTDQGILGIPAWANPTGPLLSAFEMILNKQAFTGDEIFSEDLAELEGSALVNLLKGNVTEKTEALMDYAWKTYSPGAFFIPGTWHFEKITSAAQGAKDPLGRAYNVPAALASSVGVKVQPHDSELGLEYKARHFERMAEAIDFTIWEAEKDYSRGFISESVFNEKIEKAKERAKMLERRMESFYEEAGLD